MLRKEVFSHKKQYFSLILGLGSFLVLFIYAWPSFFWVRLIGLGMGLYYVVWGLMTHSYAPRKVFLEYVVVATLGLLTVLFLTI